MLEALSVRCAALPALASPAVPRIVRVVRHRDGPVPAGAVFSMLVSCFQLRVNALADFVGRDTVADG